MSDVSSVKNNNNKSRKKQHVKDNIKVAVRCRPLLPGEKSLCEVVCNSRKNQIGVVIPRARGRDSNKLYTFDKVYNTSTKQNGVFSHSIEPIISDVLSGYNCTVFAYGQTGSGKTYTMEGNRFNNDHANNHQNDDDGIIPRAIKAIFHELARDSIESTVIVSHLEIYNEELTDLLCDLEIKKKKLTIYNDTKKQNIKGGHGVFVQGLEEIIVSSPQHIFDILSKSTSKRKTAATNLNNRSSRSHCIFTITIRIKCTINTEEIVKTGTLNLVDLAGSESIARSGAVDHRAKEAGHINTSLLTLGRVISALVERRQHIPYRESKLTRLLQESLGGRNKTLLIATISPNSPLEQTLSTLDYALRAKNITNKPQLNVSMTKEKYVKELQVLINNYKKQIDALRNEKGIILPPKQYESMCKKLEEQSGEIEKVNALFEVEKNKLIEMNELFTKTNEQLHIELEGKNALIVELNELSVKLMSVTQELKRNEFAVTQYVNNERILREQAENVKDVLKNTILHRDVLHEKIDQRANIESNNILNWDDKKNNILSKLLFIQNNLHNFKRNYDEEINKNCKFINDANGNVNNILNIINSMHQFNDNVNCKKILESQELRRNYIETNLCNTQLSEFIDLNKNNHHKIVDKYREIESDVIPNFITNINKEMTALQCKLNELNDNLNKMYNKQENENNQFTQNLNMIITEMSKDMDLYENKHSEYLNEWKKSQEMVANECKQYAANEMNKIFAFIANKQRTAFESKYDNFKEVMSAQHKKLNENHISSLNDVINKYDINRNNNNKTNAFNKNKSINSLHANIKNISENTICDWSHKINLNMKNLSDTINKSHTENNAYIANKIINDLNIFNSKCNEYDAEIIKNSQNLQNENFVNSEKLLNQHLKSMDNYNESMSKYNNEHTNKYFNNLSNNLNIIKSECQQYQISKYKKSGVTPTKQNVIYPTNFIETQPLQILIEQFNATQEPDRNGSDSVDSSHHSLSTYISSKSSKSQSSSPYFVSDEIEIDFSENELGFRMYCGDKNKNCFIRHCHSDPRVCDNAQIIGIDGIDVIGKSVGYVRTLLATKQRPISIKFKNNINNEDVANNAEKTSFLITDIMSDGVAAEESVSVSSLSVNPRKRQRDEGVNGETSIVRPKIPKLNYVTPNKKRYKKSRVTLSPISNYNEMDVDSKSDME